MRLNTGMTIAGGFLAAAVTLGLWFLLRGHWGVLAAAAILTLPMYILAAVTARGTQVSRLSEFGRGVMIGSNAAVNGAVWYAILAGPAGPGAAAAVGAVAAGIPMLAVVGPVSRFGVYQAVIGWMNWLLPASWPIVALGLLFVVLCLLGHAITGGRVESMKVRGGGVDWPTGTFFLRGGWISNLNPIDTAFNMGNFAFVDFRSSSMHTSHEAGHTLNLGAFGSLFHLIGAIDENVAGRGAVAYSERLADSNANPGAGNIPMWA